MGKMIWHRGTVIRELTLFRVRLAFAAICPDDRAVSQLGDVLSSRIHPRMTLSSGDCGGLRKNTEDIVLIHFVAFVKSLVFFVDGLSPWAYIEIRAPPISAGPYTVISKTCRSFRQERSFVPGVLPIVR